MTSLTDLPAQAKDVVFKLFMDGPQPWDWLPRTGRAQAGDEGLIETEGEWVTLSTSGLRLALDDMKLGAVKCKRKGQG